MGIAGGLDATYCEGWDPPARAVVDPLPSSVARARDERGEQYAVVLSAGDRAVGLLELAWRQYFAASWLFDEVGRRTLKAEYRLLDDDRLVRLRSEEWRYEDQHGEFDSSAWHRQCDYDLHGSVDVSLRTGGERGRLLTQSFRTGRELPDGIDGERQAVERPRFGEWAALLPVGDAPVWLTEREIPGLPVTSSGAGIPPWRPPTPLQPGDVEAMFRAGVQYTGPHAGTEFSTDTLPAGTLIMPTGQLVVADPGELSYEKRPVTVQLEPGEYKVDVGIIRFRDDPAHLRVTAARLTVSPEPVVAWKLALTEGQDPRVLGDGQFFGFGVDTGIACMVDTAGVTTLAERVDDDLELLVFDDLTSALTDPRSQANMVMFRSGWGDGSYPTWIGRTATGAISQIVVDTLILRDATLIT